MIITVKLKFEDSMKAEEASGRTGQPLPKTMEVEVMNVPLSYLGFGGLLTESWAQDIAYDELCEKVAEMLSYLGFGGLEFELVD